MNRKFIAKSNFVLRRVLNAEENIDILKEIIESILDIKIKEAKINPYLEKLKNKLPSKENFGIADLRVRTIDNQELNIGIQILDGEHIATKILLYFTQLHIGQVEYDDNREITKTTTINILDFKFLNNNKYHTKMTIREDSVNTIEEYLELHILELPKYKENNIQEMTVKEAWINYFKGENIKESMQVSDKIEKIDRLLNKYWYEETME